MWSFLASLVYSRVIVCQFRLSCASTETFFAATIYVYFLYHWNIYSSIVNLMRIQCLRGTNIEIRKSYHEPIQSLLYWSKYAALYQEID